MTPTILFWLAAFLTLYAYLGYPVLLSVLGKIMRRPVATTSAEPYARCDNDYSGA